MKIPSQQNWQTSTMADITDSSRRAAPNASMDKVRKLLSPGTRKKLVGGHKTFGVPLAELVRRAPQGYKVPYIIKKITAYIEHHGVDCEGIFRVNGNLRIVEKLKICFDVHGDANLDEDNDVMAVAGILKLFLRELPESVIPESMTRQFVNTQEENQRNPVECVRQLKQLVKVLSEEHYELLKHIVRFLAIVTCNEPINKMSPMALAIVFGPNLFRCGNGFLALKDQGTTNQIVYRFIVDYNSLFKDANEDPPAVYFERKKLHIGPPRPPPPKFVVEEVDVRPVPSPRKSKMSSYVGSHYQDYEGSHFPEYEDHEHSESSLSSRGRNSGSRHSPAFSDDEMTGRLSPFHLDSDSGFSMIESPVPSARTSEFVDKAIKATVIGHLFGDECSLLDASIDTTIREDQSESVVVAVPQDTPITKEVVENVASEGNLPIKDRIKQFEDPELQSRETTKPAKHKPVSMAFDMFEKGIITQMAGTSAVNQEPSENHTDITEELLLETEHGFETVTRQTDPLQNFKKPAGPANRRSPSRQLRRNSMDSSESMEEDDEVEHIEVLHNGYTPAQPPSRPTPGPRTTTQEPTAHTQSRIAFLDILHEDSPNKFSPDGSPDKSPTNGKKPFVPPLDFSTLHEHVGTQDAIPAHKAQTLSYQRANQQLQNHEDTEDLENAEPSPRSNKIKRKAGHISILEDEFPPFSQNDQDQYKSHSHGNTDDEMTSKMKYLMKKIQGLKRKIKQFEDVFEKENGFKPSHSEKASKPDIKKYMTELSKARKEAKKLKEEAEMGSRSRHGSGASSTGERSEPPDPPPTMGQTLDIILVRLREKRKESHRPEAIELMSPDQVQDEKLAVQKALLHFEGIHGRPKTKEEKDLMRPLYDRYRTIKRLMSRQPKSPRSDKELPTVPEDDPIDLPHQRQAKSGEAIYVEPIQVEPIRVPTANLDDDDDDGPPLATMDFAVTRDLSVLRDHTQPLTVLRDHTQPLTVLRDHTQPLTVLRDHTQPLTVQNQGVHSPKAKRKLELLENIENSNSIDSNLHELPASELQDQLIKSRNVKKKLRKTLRDFEDTFLRTNGRKVTKEDRIPLQAEYNEYKQLKSRLKLLEALLSKHHSSDV